MGNVPCTSHVRILPSDQHTGIFYSTRDKRRSIIEHTTITTNLKVWLEPLNEDLARKVDWSPKAVSIFRITVEQEKAMQKAVSHRKASLGIKEVIIPRQYCCLFPFSHGNRLNEAACNLAKEKAMKVWLHDIAASWTSVTTLARSSVSLEAENVWWNRVLDPGWVSLISLR